MSDQTITLTRIYNPLDHTEKDHIQWAYNPGATVADLLDHTGAIINQRESVKYAVSINGVQVPAEQYAETRLMPGQQVAVVPYLHGGSTDSKNVLRTVGLVVLAVIATVVSVFVPALWPVTGFLWKMAFMSAYMTIGMAIYGALGGYDNGQQSAISNGYQGNNESQSYSWNPQTTQQQGIAIPWRYGITKITGNIIGVYRENIGTQQYVNVLISLGEGPISPPYDIKLNGQPLANYTGVTLYTRLGHLDQDPIPNFGDTVTEYPQGTKINYGTPITYTTIGSSFDTLAIQVGCPNGLYRYDDYGNLQPLSINFSIEISPHGLNTWTHIATSAGTIKVSDGGYWSAGWWTFEGDTIGTGWLEWQNGGSDPNSHYEGEIYASGSAANWRWIGEPIRVVDIVNQYATISAGQTGQVLFTARANGLDVGKYDVRITRLTTDYTDTRYGDEFYLMAVQEIILDDFTCPGEALIGLRALATDQLSGYFSFECKSAGKLCRVYDGSTWTVAATSNPAWVCFDILTQPIFNNRLNVVGYRAYDPADLDLARWLEWADYCNDLVPDGEGGTEPRLTYNGAFDSNNSMWDAALAVARIGRAVPFWRGQTITVSVDMPSDPVALISVGNIGLDSFEETFLPLEDRAGSIEADFLNFDKDLDRDKFTVLNPDAPASWGNASLQLQGVIKPSEIWRHCRYYLATTQNLLRVVTVQMDVDSIAFTLGDVINMQHDVPMWGFGGRIVAATSSTVTLDQEVTLTAGTTYSIMVRLLDNTLVERVISNPAGSYTTLTVSTPFSAIPSQYDPYAFGPIDTLVKPMRVNGIDPAGDLKRKITLTDYNATVWNADQLQPVLPTVNYTGSNLPLITGLLLSEHMVLSVGGNVTTMLDVTWSRVNSSLVRYIEVLVNGASQSLLNADATSLSIPVVDGSTVLVQVRTVGWIGNYQNINLAAVASHDVIGKTAPPSNISTVASRVDLQGVIITWLPVSDVDLEAYLIRRGDTWTSGVQVAKTIDVTALLGYLPIGTTTIKVKALDTSGNESLADATTTATVQAPSAPAPGFTIDGTDCTISWNDCTTSYGLDRYEIKYGTSFDAGVAVSTVKGQSLKLPITWTGSRTYWVRAVDAAGNAGPAGSVVVSISAASAPVVSATLSGTMCKLTWNIPSSTLPIDRYEIRIGSTWAAAISLGTVKGTAYSLPATWPSAQLWVAAIDANNTTGAPGSVSVTVSMPVVSGLTADVIDNNVLLRWISSQGSLAVDHYEVRRGATWAAGSTVGTTSATFCPLFESASGQYTYWVAAIDAAGNQGTPASVAAMVNQPPDYILNADWTSTLSGTKTNLFNDPVNGWVALVRTDETWATHFTNNSKTTIQQFIDAGYTQYMQPATASASYVEVFDYGTILAGTKITVSLDHVALIGSPAVACKIETSPDNISWTVFDNMWMAYGAAFRYVRVTISWTSGSQSIDKINGLNVRLDSKIRNDAGSGTVSVAASGASCVFNIDFVDVTSITVTPSGTTAKYAIYDFVDVPNPTGFTVYLYDSAGNRTTGAFSWSARGY